jgi:hypothetical protein
MRRREPPGADTAYQLKVTLREVEPEVWRRVQVSGEISLSQLHQVLQIVMGWESAHLYQFTVGGASYGEPDPESTVPLKSDRRARLSQVAPAEKQRLVYEYDFGDGWEHDIVVEKIFSVAPNVRYPVCLIGARACPPEDCGGPPGYESLLEALRSSDHPEHEAMVEWVGGYFDPEAFDVEVVNRNLRRFKLR